MWRDFWGVSTFPYSFLTCKILGNHLMPLATLAKYYFFCFCFRLRFQVCFWFKTWFWFLFVFAQLDLFQTPWLEWAVGYRIFQITAVLCLGFCFFGSGFFLGCGAVSSEDRSGPESSNKSKPSSERPYFTSRWNVSRNRNWSGEVLPQVWAFIAIHCKQIDSNSRIRPDGPRNGSADGCNSVNQNAEGAAADWLKHFETNFIFLAINLSMSTANSKFPVDRGS